MKKIFLVSLFGCCIMHALAAASLEVRDVNGNVVTGMTFYYTLPGGSPTHTVNFDFYNIGSSPVSYKITKTNVTIDPGALSWFTISQNNDPNSPINYCYPPAMSTPPHNYYTQAGDFNRLGASFDPGTNTATSVVHYVMFDMNNVADSAGITLVYNVTPSGIASLYDANSLLGEAYPNPSQGIFSFTSGLPENETVMILVQDMNGELAVKQAAAVSGGTIRLDLSGLSSGLYVCRFADSSGEIALRRLMMLNP